MITDENPIFSVLVQTRNTMLWSYEKKNLFSREIGILDIVITRKQKKRKIDVAIARKWAKVFNIGHLTALLLAGYILVYELLPNM